MLWTCNVEEPRQRYINVVTVTMSVVTLKSKFYAMPISETTRAGPSI